VRQQNSGAVKEFILPYSAVYLRIQWWKNYWNRFTFAKVIVKIKVAPYFMAHGVDCVRLLLLHGTTSGQVSAWGSRDQYGSYPSSFWHYPTWLVRGALVQADRPQPLVGCPLTCSSSATSVGEISSSLFVFENIFFLALPMSVRVVVMSNHNDRLFDCVENIWRRYIAGCWWQLHQCTSTRSRICQRGNIASAQREPIKWI